MNEPEEWKDPKKTRPEWDYRVLCYNSSDGVFVGRYDYSWLNLEGEKVKVTHWMHLPKEPDRKGKTG